MENLYPSITTVLSVRNKKGLYEWRKRVGDEVAKLRCSCVLANRGTAVHHMCEDYLNNDFDEAETQKEISCVLSIQNNSQKKLWILTTFMLKSVGCIQTSTKS